MTPQAKILLVRLSALGDVVHTLPSAMLIKSVFPEAEIHWLVQESFYEILKGHPAIDVLHTIPRRFWRMRVTGQAPTPPIVSAIYTLRNIRRHRYFAALDMQGLLKSAIWVGLSKAEYKLGYHFQREGSKFFSRAVKPAPEHAHVIDQYRDVGQELLRLMGINLEKTSSPAEFGLRPDAEALQRARQMLEECASRGRPLAVNLGAGKLHKRYPIPLFADFVFKAHQHGWAPFCVGSIQEKVLYENLHQHLSSMKKGGRSSAFTSSPIVTTLVGRTSLTDLVALLALSEAHVAGDTGTLHIAVALGKPVVALMGPTKPERTGPYKRPESVLYKGPDGLGKITPEEILQALQRVTLTPSDACVNPQDSETVV